MVYPEIYTDKCVIPYDQAAKITDWVAIERAPPYRKIDPLVPELYFYYFRLFLLLPISAWPPNTNTHQSKS